MRDLCRALLRIKVRPYYLFHCDPVTGAGHFRTSVWKGLEIIEGLRGHISGLGVPTYVVDAPRGGGKIPLMPNYLVSASNEAVILRNYEGMLVRYNPEGHAEPDQPALQTQGVSALLAGQREVLMPEGTPRMLRRQAIALSASAPAHPDFASSPHSSIPLPGGRDAVRSGNTTGGSRRNGHAVPRTARAIRTVVAEPVTAMIASDVGHKAARAGAPRKKAAV
jgi:lysine 2,3-aminomutase